jgi:glyoxylase-like metal-dependent hydrolase (beta-lactamase superfamily II)
MAMQILRYVLALVPAALAGCAAAHESYVLQPGHIDLAIGPDGNTVILDAPAGLVVVDTGRHAEHSEAILAHARMAGKRVAAVVNTHWHLDHTTGNRDVLAAYPEARLVATNAIEGALTGFLAEAPERARARAADETLPENARARARRNLAALEDRAALVPAEPVAADTIVAIAGRRFELHVAPAAATEADLWLVAPDEKIAVVGDLVVAPVPFFDTACEEGWRKALGTIAAAEWTTLIPGHGEPMTRADFSRWRGAFGNWLDCAASSRAASECAKGWMANAAGFYTAEEAGPVRTMAEAYVAQVLRAPPGERMTYCEAKN